MASEKKKPIWQGETLLDVMGVSERLGINWRYVQVLAYRFPEVFIPRQKEAEPGVFYDLERIILLIERLRAQRATEELAWQVAGQRMINDLFAERGDMPEEEHHEWQQSLCYSPGEPHEVMRKWGDRFGTKAKDAWGILLAEERPFELADAPRPPEWHKAMEAS